MPRYFLKCSYVGTAYHGWQVQENTPITVQQVMNEKLSELLNEKVDLTGCGRTDTGVHAREFYAHFDLQRDILEQKETDWVYKFNCVLPFDLAVQEIIRVKDTAHARYDAVARTYQYYIIGQRDPFLREWSYHVHSPLQLDDMNKACAVLMEYSDFSSFSKSNTQVKTNECHIKEARFDRVMHGQGTELVVFTIRADRFLRNMVRAIVGTMIEVGKGRMKPEEIRGIIEKKDRSEAGTSVPAQGLYLVRVEYDKDIFIS